MARSPASRPAASTWSVEGPLVEPSTGQAGAGGTRRRWAARGAPRRGRAGRRARASRCAAPRSRRRRGRSLPRRRSPSPRYAATARRGRMSLPPTPSARSAQSRAATSDRAAAARTRASRKSCSTDDVTAMVRSTASARSARSATSGWASVCRVRDVPDCVRSADSTCMRSPVPADEGCRHRPVRPARPPPARNTQPTEHSPDRHRAGLFCTLRPQGPRRMHPAPTFLRAGHVGRPAPSSVRSAP